MNRIKFQSYLSSGIGNRQFKQRKMPSLKCIAPTLVAFRRDLKFIVCLCIEMNAPENHLLADHSFCSCACNR